MTLGSRQFRVTEAIGKFASSQRRVTWDKFDLSSSPVEPEVSGGQAMGSVFIPLLLNHSLTHENLSLVNMVSLQPFPTAALTITTHFQKLGICHIDLS